MKKIAITLLSLTFLITVSNNFAWHRRSYCGWYDRRCGNIRSCDYNRCCNYSNCSYNTINRYNPIYPTYSNCCYPNCYPARYSMQNCCSTNGCNYATCCGNPVTRVEENPPCGPAPCCLKTVEVPANLVQKVDYYWECPQNCNSCLPQNYY